MVVRIRIKRLDSEVCTSILPVLSGRMRRLWFVVEMSQNRAV